MARLDDLMKMHGQDPADAFILYAIAQEHASAGRHAEAIDWFRRCLASDASYLYAYFHAARSMDAAGDRAGALTTVAEGLARARTARDQKAMSELQSLIDELEDA